MRHARRITAVMLGAAILAAPLLAARAQEGQAAQIFSIPQSGVEFITGDTWRQGGQQFRIYGIQSCIRGTSYTNAAKVKQDCGEASLAVLAALVKDTRPSCSPVAQLRQGGDSTTAPIIVICTVHIAGNALDLGQVLITQGFAFAAFTNEAKPVYMPYLVSEVSAKNSRAGLWQFPDMPHPNQVLFRAIKSELQSPSHDR